jgi:hypothetical protein
MRENSNIGAVAGLITLYFIIAWVVNLVQLLSCDFSNHSWKQEIVHGIGLIPVVSGVTCWM